MLIAAALPLSTAHAAAPATPSPAQAPAVTGSAVPLPAPPQPPAASSTVAAPAAVAVGRVPAELSGLPADATAGEAQPTQVLAIAAARQHGHRVVVDSLSDDRTTTFAGPDGALSKVIYPAPMFHSESGHRVRTDPAIITVADATYPRQAPHADSPLAIGADSAHLLRWDLPTGTVTVRLAPTGTAAPTGVTVPAPLTATVAGTAAGHVLLAGALQHADLDVSSTPTGPRVDLVLADATAPRTLALLVDDPTGALGGLGSSTPQGGWQFPAAGGHYAILPPYAYQQHTSPGPVTPPDPSSAHLTVTAAGPHSYLVTETVDGAWLVGKTFPVVLDPAISDQYETQMPDCQLFSGSYQYTNYCPSGTSYYDAASNVGYNAHALMQPDLSIITNGGTYLRQAYFVLYATSASTQNNGINTEDICSAGTFWGSGPNTTWANTAGGTPLASTCVPFNNSAVNTGYQGIDVTAATRGALAGQYPYYGFVLKNDNETCCSQYTQFDGAGGNHPSFFVINYGLPPNAPQNAAASINSSGTFTVSWASPAASPDADPTDGYTGYLYQCGHGGQDYVAGAGFSAESAPHTWSMSGLNPAQCYTFLLFPHNDAGYNTPVSVLAQTYAQAPAFASVAGGSNTVSGAITYPSIDGTDGRYPFSASRAYAVNQYLLFLYPAGQSWPTNTPVSCQSVNANGNNMVSYTFDSSHGTSGYCNGSSYTPANGTSYTVQVFAINGSGAGNTSSGALEGPGLGVPAVSAAVTPAGVPFPVQNVSVTADEARVDVTWTPPPAQVSGIPGDNGSAVTAYLLVATPLGGGASVSSTVGVSTASTIDNLVDGVAYSVSVSAVNGVGTGQSVLFAGNVTPTRVSTFAGAPVTQTLTGLGQVNFGLLPDTGTDTGGPVTQGPIVALEKDTSINAPLVRAPSLSSLTTYKSSSASGGTGGGSSGGSASPATTTTDGLVQRGPTSPPDTNGAIGPNYAAETVNNSLAVYSKASPAQMVHRATLQSMFHLPAGTSLTDPHVIYDPIGGGFGHFALVVDGLQNWYLAVSPTSDPTGTWNTYSVPMYNIGGRCGDYPGLGSSHYFTILTATVYNDPGCAPSSSVVDSQAVAIDTSALLSYSPNPGNTLWYNLHDQGYNDGYAFRVSPVNQYVAADPGTYDDAYLLDSYAVGGSHITVWQIDAQRQTLRATRISTPRYQAPVNAAQPSDGGGNPLNNPSTTITNSFYNGYGAYAAIDSTLTSQADGKAYDGIIALRIGTTRGSEGVRNSVALVDAGSSLIYPTYAGDSTSSGAGEVTLTRVGPSIEPTNIAFGVDYTGKLSATSIVLATSDTAITPDACGQANDHSCRFGDYSSVYPDPSYANTFWTFNEYVGKIFNNKMTAGWKTSIGQYLHDS